MLSNANKQQLAEISAYIGADFGIADDVGHVLFYSGESSEDSVSTELATVFAELQNDDTVNFYEMTQFARGGYLFDNVTVDSDEMIFMFVKIDSYNGGASETLKGTLKNVLALAAHGFRYRESQSSKDLINIFKKLLIEGRRTVTEEQLEAVYGDFMANANGYAVVLVALNVVSGTPAGDSDLICRILQELFGTERGFLIIPIDYARTAIVCPLKEDMTYDYVIEYANMIKDTLLLEAMVETYVSVSSQISSLMNLNEAYIEADKAKNIGVIFEMTDKCLEYSKLGLEKLIYSIPMDACIRYVQETFGEGFVQDKSAKELFNTVKVYLENNLNVSEASRMLYIHRNTLMYRLEKFNKMTGLECSKFDVGMRIGIALLILQFIENKEPALLNKI